jgi:valyl-tRNA synthetase
MSKQLGNSPDLLEMIDKDGADAVRFGIMISSPAGNDLMWDQAGNEQGRFFINKMWNALKLIRSWESRVGSQAASNDFAVEWFENRLNEARTEIEELYRDFRLSEILKTIYSLIWDDFCSWYLEWIKPGFEQPIDKPVYKKTVDFFEQLLQLLHPFMPFISEEIFHQLEERKDDVCGKQLKKIGPINKRILEEGKLLKEIITSIRDVKNRNKINPKEPINIYFEGTSEKDLFKILSKQVFAEKIEYAKGDSEPDITLTVDNLKIFIEVKSFNKTQNSSIQKDQLIKDLDYQKGFLASVEKKLSNERFVQHAKPEVIEIERKKKADAEAKIKAIEESLLNL